MSVFPGFGTLVNVITIILTGILGTRCGKYLSAQVRDGLQAVLGLAVFLVGLSGVIAGSIVVDTNGVLITQRSLGLVLCLCIGTLLGELLNLETGIEQLGLWLRERLNRKDDSQFLNAFVTTSMIVSIGAMAVVGAIQDGIAHDPSTLITKSIMDGIMCLTLASSLGIGVAAASVSVGIFQGGVMLLSLALAPFLTTHAISWLSFIGNALILCVGINVVWHMKLRIANMLPALILAVVWAHTLA